MPDLTIKSISHPQTNFAPTTMTAAMFLSGLLSHFYRENMFRKLRGFSLHVFESTQKWNALPENNTPQLENTRANEKNAGSETEKVLKLGSISAYPVLHTSVSRTGISVTHESD